MNMRNFKKEIERENKNIAVNILKNLVLMNSTQNMLHSIATMKAKFLLIVLENINFDEFDELYMADLEAIESPYYYLKEYNRLDKNIDQASYKIFKHYACIHHLVHKINDIINKDTVNVDKLEKINRMLRQTLEQYKTDASKSEKYNLILQEILTDILYNNMKKFGLITDAELEKLMK